MNFKYSKHAIQQIDHRNLDIKLIDEILENPDRIIIDFAQNNQIVGIEILNASANVDQVNGALYEMTNG